jgi:hypothetical protein
MEHELAGLLLIALVVGIPIALAKLQSVTVVPSKEGKTIVIECKKCGHRIPVTITS